ncbi:hypothetical protein L345_08193 [Ophiophagus hannah]|uniref:Uncharacterized protein n=1 Tax=Ophiophagus hannah TaxID=8665 RepID=V8NVD5_OPHHA|nr:hypothetical protein L345_08193 [Ophiophagus hannah]
MLLTVYREKVCSRNFSLKKNLIHI